MLHEPRQYTLGNVRPVYAHAYVFNHIRTYDGLHIITYRIKSLHFCGSVDNDSSFSENFCYNISREVCPSISDTLPYSWPRQAMQTIPYRPQSMLKLQAFLRAAVIYSPNLTKWSSHHPQRNKKVTTKRHRGKLTRTSEHRLV